MFHRKRLDILNSFLVVVGHDRHRKILQGNRIRECYSNYSTAFDLLAYRLKEVPVWNLFPVFRRIRLVIQQTVFEPLYCTNSSENPVFSSSFACASRMVGSR